jgi:hypothetical protein
MYKPRLNGRLATGLAALGLVASVAAGCSEDSGSEDDGEGPGGPDVVADSGDMTDGGDEMDAASPDTSESDAGSDAGGTEATYQGEEVSASEFQVFPPLAASCSNPGERQRIPFYLKRSERTPDGRIPPIRQGDYYFGQKIEPNGVVGAGTVGTRRMRVSEVSDNQCGSSNQCGEKLKCAESGVRGAQRYCTRQTGVEFIPGTARQDVEPNAVSSDKQVVALALDNTASYDGLIPSSVGGQYDENGEKFLLPKQGRATDPNLKNREAVRTFATFLATAADPSNTSVSFWFFGGENPTNAQPTVDAMSQQDHFTDDLEYPKVALDTHSAFRSQDGEEKGPVPKPANVYQAIDRIIEKDLGIDKYADYEKFLFLITDGPNEVFDSDATKEKLVSRLNEHDIHLYIMHLDARFDDSLLRDLPTYWAGSSDCNGDSCASAPTCQSDADCSNFETCRKAKIYPDEDPTDSETDAEVTETSSKYCMPDYSGGRLGPVDEYADLACQTQGNYLYVRTPDELVFWARHLPYLIDGRWSVEAEISAFDEKVGLSDGFYNLSGTFLGTLAPNLSSTLTAPTVEGARQSEPNDTRGLMRLQRSE